MQSLMTMNTLKVADAAAAGESAPKAAEGPQAPSVRRLSAESGVDASTVPGSSTPRGTATFSTVANRALTAGGGAVIHPGAADRFPLPLRVLGHVGVAPGGGERHAAAVLFVGGLALAAPE